MLSKEITLTNKGGLHARPAKGLVELCVSFQSAVTIELEGKKADAKSILSLMMLGINTGKTIAVAVEGTDEEQAMQKIVSYLTNLSE